MKSQANSTVVGDDYLSYLIDEHERRVLPGLERLWGYYRNELDFECDGERGLYGMDQSRGLPRRLREAGADGEGREVVIENDIAWRIHTLVDFMAGKPVRIRSMARDPELADVIDRVLTAVMDANEGVGLMQDAVLLGSVYGHVDLMLRTDRLPAFMGERTHLVTGDDRGRDVPSKREDLRRVLRYASRLVLETVEAPRAIPVLNESDYRVLDGYVVHYRRALNAVDRESFVGRLVGGDGVSRGRRKTEAVTEQWTGDRVRTYVDGVLVDERENVLGRVPVVHIQNLPQPYFYEGLSEVEPLIPLQDELNTRLSDRANRVTFQSFKMYLGKGIENFLERPVGPGQMWTTDNPDASVEAFGGDGASPSEDVHIEEVRAAMDKASAVTPVAAGLLQGGVGNLRSENALRVVLMGLLARTEKKRVTYGRGIQRLCAMVLEVMDIAGVLKTEEADRRVALHWPSPLPENTTQRLRDAQMKVELGVPREQVLAASDERVRAAMTRRMENLEAAREAQERAMGLLERQDELFERVPDLRRWVLEQTSE